MQMDFDKAINEFVQQRINSFEENETELVTNALTAFNEHLERLNGTDDYDDFGYCGIVLMGELKNRYYRAGFADAVKFIFGWRDGEWN